MFREDLLKGKTIIITGGGSGLGKSMAARFGELGANLVIASRRQQVIQDAADELRNTGAEVLGLTCDVRDVASVQTLVDRTKKQFGTIDVLLNNAAGNFISPTENLSPNGFKVVVDIVLHGTFNCTHAVGKEMIANGGGSILNIVATYAWTGSGYVVPSAAAKAGVLAITRSLAGLGIEKKMKNRIPLKRFGEHIELANLASYLISDEAGYINGEVVTIDGGEWLKGAGQFNDLDKMPKMAWKAMDAMRKKSKK